MKIIVLSDNNTLREDLETEHGLCIYIENDGYKCLLDTGASDVFVRNAEKLNVDLKAVDYVFISHGHADHIGGLPAFLDINTKAKIVMSANVLQQKYFSKRNGLHSISIAFDWKSLGNRLVLVDEEAKFENDIQVLRVDTLKHAMPLGNSNLYKEIDNEMLPDDFDHELVVCIGSEEILVFTGCAHKGLLNILEALHIKPNERIRCVVGGFHLLDAKGETVYETETALLELAQTLKRKYPFTDFITGHCTGKNAFTTMKKYLEFRLIHFFTGYTY